MEREMKTELVRSAIEGDRRAFEALYRSEINSIIGQARQITRNQHDAEDIAQTVVLKLYQKIGQLRDPENFSAWVHRMVMNECKMMYRKKYIKNNRILTFDDTELSMLEDRTEFLTHEFCEDEEKRQALLEIMDTLPVKYKQVLFLYYFEDLSTTEIAEATGTNRNTVMSNLGRGRGIIAKQLEKKFGPIEVGSVAPAAVPVLKLVYEYDIKQAFNPDVSAAFFKRCEGALDAADRTKAVVKLNRALCGTLGILTVTAVVLALILKSPAALPLSLPGVPTLPTEISGEAFGIDTTLDDAPSEQAGQDPAGGTGTPSTGSPVAVTLTGKIMVMGQDGEFLTSDIGEDLRLALYAGEECLARTDAKRNGEYSFGPVELMSDRTCEIRVELPDKSLLTPTNQNPGGKTPIFPPQEDGELDIPVYLTSKQSSAINVVLAGADCGCGHVNPRRIDFVTSLQTGIDSWEIKSANSEKALYKGTDQSIELSLKELYSNQRDGKYLVVFYYTDASGEVVEKDFVIRIYTGPLEPGLFE